MTGENLAVRDFGGQALATRVPLSEAIEKALMEGDLSGLSTEHRVEYYHATCKSLGLNPLTRPFEYVVLNRKLTLYARKDCTEQLRRLNGISIRIIERRMENGVYLVVAEATTPDGRRDEASGAVAVEKEGGSWVPKSNGQGNVYQTNGTFVPIRGDDLANALMKAETKAKRRVTLSICGLGLPDESELETIPGAQVAEDGTHYTPTKYICQECKGEIATSDKGASPAEVASFTSKKLGKQLCAGCANKELDARKAAREAAKAETARLDAAIAETFPPIHEELSTKGSTAKALTSARARYNIVAAYATSLGMKAPEHKASHTASQLEEMIRSLSAEVIDAINAVALMDESLPTDAIPGDKAELEDWWAFATAYDLVESIREEVAGLEKSEDLEEEAVY